MSLTAFQQTGVFTNGITVEELIENLQEYNYMYGNQPIHFSLDGEDECHVQFDYFKNALTIDVNEEIPR